MKIGARYITVIVLFPIVAYLVFWASSTAFDIVITLLILAATKELYEILAIRGLKPLKVQGYLYSIVGCYLFHKGNMDAFWVLITVMVATLFIERIFWREELPRVPVDIASTLMGFFYITWFGGHLMLLRQYSADVIIGKGLIVVFLVIIWMGDTGAMHVGKRLGKNKLAPILSPNKTQEGALGGLLSSMVFAIIFGWIACPYIKVADLMFLGLIVGAVGQIGDLAESMLKRSVAIKDSGAIFPGHGGAMDRIDSLFFAAPAFYYYLKFFIGPLSV